MSDVNVTEELQARAEREKRAVAFSQSRITAGREMRQADEQLRQQTYQRQRQQTQRQN